MRDRAVFAFLKEKKEKKEKKILSYSRTKELQLIRMASEFRYLFYVYI